MRWQDHDDEDDVDYDGQNVHQHGGDSGVDDAIIAIMTLAPVNANNSARLVFIAMLASIRNVW